MWRGYWVAAVGLFAALLGLPLIHGSFNFWWSVCALNCMFLSALLALLEHEKLQRPDDHLAFDQPFIPADDSFSRSGPGPGTTSRSPIAQLPIAQLPIASQQESAAPDLAYVEVPSEAEAA